MNTTRPVLPWRLGVSASGEDVVLDLADSVSYLVQGSTRSGKSVSVYGLLQSLAADPRVIISGIDPSGILLNPWANHPRPDWRHSFAQDFTAAADTLERIVGEMDRRIHWLVDHDLEKLAYPTVELPFVWVVLEEYPGTLDATADEDAASGRKGADQQQPRIKRYTSRLIREGQKAGCRVLIIAQRAEANIVSGDNRSNVGGRLTHRVDNADSVKMLHPRVTPDLVDWVTGYSSPLIRPGLGLLQVPGYEGIRQVRVDFTTYEHYLATVRAGSLAQQQFAAERGLDWEKMGHPDLFGPVNQYEEDWTDDHAAAS